MSSSPATPPTMAPLISSKEITQTTPSPQTQNQIASDALDTYIDMMMQDSNMNVRAIPDPIEKFLYKRMIPGFMRCSKWILSMMLQRIIFGQIAGRLGGKFGILKKLM